MVAYSFKARFEAPIRAGLGDKAVKARPKRQTIRAHGKRRHAITGDLVQIYVGMRTKHCRLIGHSRCTAQRRVKLWYDPKGMTIMVDGKMLGPRQAKKFAQADGFEDQVEMAAFWRAEHGIFESWEGVLIEWEPFA